MNTNIEEVFSAVCRYDFSLPGFYYIDLGANFGSREMRIFMIELKRKLQSLLYQKKQQYLEYLSFDRSSRAFTTRFHLEATSSLESILCLGYEPTSVKSCLHICDYTKYIYDNKMPSQDFFSQFSKILKEQDFTSYISTIELNASHFQVIVVNNSFYPEVFGEQMLGVLHKGEAFSPCPGDLRLINAMAIGVSATEGSNEEEQSFIDRETYEKIERY